MEQSSPAFGFVQALGILRRRAVLILVCTIVVAGSAFVFSEQQPAEYTATASLVFNDNPLSQQIVGLGIGSSSSQFVQQASNVELVGLGDVAAETAKQLRHGLTEQRIRESISIAGQGETNIVSVSATAKSPALAADIATTYAQQFVREQQRANAKFLGSALALVEKQLDTLPRSQRFGPAAAALQNREQQLGLLKSLKYGNVSMAQAAPSPTTPSSPHTRKNTLLGALLGLVLGLGFAFLLERLRRDRCITGLDALEEVYRAPVLGVVPERTTGSRLARGVRSHPEPLSATEAEVFHLIRARMRVSSRHGDRHMVLIGAASHGEGTTTISRCLAETAALSGSRVLLLEANLRDPILAEELDLTGPGLAEVIGGTASFADAVQPMVAGSTFSGQPNHPVLDVLQAGTAITSSPMQLLESPAMESLLAHIRSTYDLVVIDAPPLTTVSDAFALLRQVDGVVLVSWIGRTPRNLAHQLRETLAESGIPQLGVIANGAKADVVSTSGRVNRVGPGSAAEPTAGPTPQLPPSHNPVHTIET